LFHSITLFWVETAELVFHVVTGLAAKVKQIFALHVQFARQGIDTDFVFLQAQLLYRHSPYSPLPVAGRSLPPYPFILTDQDSLKRGIRKQELGNHGTKSGIKEQEARPDP
jgi:hypothetical protein